MAPFAEVPELEAGWRELDAAERGRAAALLARASTAIRAAMRNARVEIDPGDEIQAASLADVACSMARRHMALGDSMVGVTQRTQTANGFQASVTTSAAVADGVMQLTQAEREQLGIFSRRPARAAMAQMGGPDGR